MKIKLTCSKDSFVIINQGPGNPSNQIAFKYVITDARFFIHTVRLSDTVALAHEQMLLSTNARYPIARVTLKHLTIGQRQSAAQFDNIYLGELPDRIILAMVTDASMSGGYQQNPFNFQHFGVNHLVLYVNGEMMPTKPFQPDFAHGRYIREYASLVESLGVLFTDKSVPITRAEFGTAYTIYGFDLTADQACSRCLSPTRNGIVRLEVKFTAPTVATLNVICFA